jgi:hypothetical protein
VISHCIAGTLHAFTERARSGEQSFRREAAGGKQTLRREAANIDASPLDGVDPHIAAVEKVQAHGIILHSFEVRLESEQTPPAPRRISPAVGNHHRPCPLDALAPQHGPAGQRAL